MKRNETAIQRNEHSNFMFYPLFRFDNGLLVCWMLLQQSSSTGATMRTFLPSAFPSLFCEALRAGYSCHSRCSGVALNHNRNLGCAQFIPSALCA
jgi:hypothetical protein